MKVIIIKHIATTLNNEKQFSRVVLLRVKKPPHHHHHTTGMITFRATSRQPTKLSFSMQPYINPTRRNMEDDLNIFENGRRPQFFENGRRPQFFWKRKNDLI